jgi:lipoate-protein ligase A
MSGAMNMALDDALLQSVSAGSSPPILRLYRWKPATLTLGYAQRVNAGIDLGACRRAGVDVVRRPTGGRAVLHDQEVTYAIISPVGHPFGMTVSENYRVIAGILMAVLRHFDLPAELVPGRSRGGQGKAVCFTAPAQHELLIKGCKVAGCAQKRRGSTFLQHGSIPVELDLDLLNCLLPGEPGRGNDERLQTIGWLNRFSARQLCRDEVESRLADCFASSLGLRLEEGEPTPDEVSLAQGLYESRYGNLEWTLSGPGRRKASLMSDDD